MPSQMTLSTKDLQPTIIWQYKVKLPTTTALLGGKHLDCGHQLTVFTKIANCYVLRILEHTSLTMILLSDNWKTIIKFKTTVLGKSKNPCRYQKPTKKTQPNSLQIKNLLMLDGYRFLMRLNLIG